MLDEFCSLLRNYLDGKAPLDSVRDWIGAHLGNPPSDVEDLMLDVAMAMWEIEGGYGTEADFRADVSGLLAEALAPAPAGNA